MTIKGESRTLEAGDYRRALAGKLGKGWCCQECQMRAGISYLEGPIQHLYPLELSYDKTSHAHNVDTTLRPVAPEERKTKQNKKKKAKIGGG